MEFFQNYLFPDPEKLTDHFELKTIGLVGGPGTGKTTTDHFLDDFIRKSWGEENVNSMCTDDAQLGVENFDDKFAQVMTIDDAISKQDSRRAMSSANVTSTQQFMLVRHIAEETRAGGIIYVIFCFQDPSGIDVRFRKVCDIILYKVWFDKCGMEGDIQDPEMVNFLKKITREQKLFNNFEYRQYSVGRTSWGDLIALKTPFIPKSEYHVRMITTEGKKETIKLGLIDEITQQDILCESMQTIYGWLYNLQTRRHDMQLYNFNQTDYKEIIYRAKAKMLVEGKHPNKNEIYLFKLLEFAKAKTGASFIGLENETGIPHTFLHRLAQKFDGKLDPKQELLNQIMTRGEEVLKNKYPDLWETLQQFSKKKESIPSELTM